jgi:hypothetical protein
VNYSGQKPWHRSQRILSAIVRRRWVAVRQQYAEAEGQAGMAVLFELHGRRDFFRNGELPIFMIEKMRFVLKSLS